MNEMIIDQLLEMAAASPALLHLRLLGEWFRI